MNSNDIPTSHSSSDQPSCEKAKPNTNKSLKHPSKISKQQIRPNPIQRQTSSTKPSCTRCGVSRLVDITQHEFPKQKSLVFECLSCGNNSIRSNVSDDERRRRLAKVAADHLNIVECQFCGKRLHSRNDYLMHLRNDHESNGPV
jgi:predicted RNA-binding Zn-ribbon protein involved in translation (DUF1610 family)